MKIAIGSDHGGFLLKQKIMSALRQHNHTVIDCGTHSTESVDYPKYAFAVAHAVSRRQAERGILICKSGIGNSIAANRVRGVRAALCHTMKAAILSRQHNNANILVLGSLFTTSALAKRMVATWLSTPFEGGRHLRRVKQLDRLNKT